MNSTKRQKTLQYLILLFLFANLITSQHVKNSRKTIYASNVTPFRRELTAKLTETKSGTRGNNYPLDYASLRQTPIEPQLRLGM